MGTRWKWKGAKQKALADPMSQIVSQLQSCLIQSNPQVLLTSSCGLLEANTQQSELLERACFGCCEEGQQWFKLSLEETFYLSFVLKCIRVIGEDKCEKSCEELWSYMMSKRENFVNLIKAYSHLRLKNWVVKSGSQYGADFVAYRHHPSLVHSEFSVLALSDGNGENNGRLLVWSDLEGAVRLSGGVAKTLLVLYIDKCGTEATSPSCLESYVVEERIIKRWSPEQCREGQTGEKRSLDANKKGPKKSNTKLPVHYAQYQYDPWKKLSLKNNLGSIIAGGLVCFLVVKKVWFSVKSS